MNSGIMKYLFCIYAPFIRPYKTHILQEAISINVLHINIGMKKRVAELCSRNGEISLIKIVIIVFILMHFFFGKTHYMYMFW